MFSPFFFRFSPKNVCPPAPTPATPATRGSRRYRSYLQRTSTKDSLSRLHNVSELKLEGIDGNQAKQVSTVQSENSCVQNNIGFQKVSERNWETLQGTGNELSKVSPRQNNTEAECQCLEKVADSESAMSDRAVSPSSRINIPSDIWAELRSGGAFDHRRITPQSHSDLQNPEQHRTLLRGYHSSLGLSVYSYTGEANWKPHPPRLPKSFTYMGVYKPTILPKMPAALTIVPVPSVTRQSHMKEQETRVPLSKVRSIRVPPVPTGSPVSDIDIASASSASIVTTNSAVAVENAGNKRVETQNSEIVAGQEERIERKYSLSEEVCCIYKLVHI